MISRFLLKSVQRAFYSSSSITSKNYDVVIVGGGMVGSALACKLRRNSKFADHSIALVEAQSSPAELRSGDNPDLRVSSLSMASVKLLKEAGAWSRIEQSGRFAPFSSMHVWDAVGKGAITFSGQEVSETGHVLGYVVENRLIQHSLFEELKELQVDILQPVSLTCLSVSDPFEQLHAAKELDNNGSLKPRDSWAKLQLSDGSNLSARLVVGCDGAQSQVRSMAAIGTTGYSYNQVGVVASVQCSEPNLIAWQRFLPDGPLALLPLFENYSSIVWSMGKGQAERLLALDDEQFLSELVDAFNGQYSTQSNVLDGLTGLLAMFSGVNSEKHRKKFPHLVDMVGKRAAFPLRLLQANSYTSRRVALVGDAAHCIHPLAGQGVNLGYADVDALVNLLIEAVDSGCDIGDPVVLRAYEKNRTAKNTPMIVGMDAIQRLFSTSFPPLVLARSAGISFVDNFATLKKVFSDAAGSSVS